jgi:hypothetical protein
MEVINAVWGSSIDRIAKQNPRLPGPPPTIESVVNATPP